MFVFKDSPDFSDKCSVRHESSVILGGFGHYAWIPQGDMMTAHVLTASEVAEHLKLSIDTVYTLTRQGHLPGIKIGGQWRFDATQVQGLLETQTSEGAQELAARPDLTA